MVDEDEEEKFGGGTILSLEKGDDADGDRKSEQRGREDQRSTEVISIELERWTDARAALARLETRLESSREDVTRAVEYARELEAECDRLAEVCRRTRESGEHTASELDEVRGRNLELREQYELLVEKLEEMSGLRGRYHLERGRREQLEEENEALRTERLELERRVGTLLEALDEAKKAGFRAELGPLLVELKR